MKIPLKLRIYQATIVRAPGKPQNRTVFVVLQSSDGQAIQFEVSLKEGAQWLAAMDYPVELDAGFVVRAARGFKDAPVDLDTDQQV